MRSASGAWIQKQYTWTVPFNAYSSWLREHHGEFWKRLIGEGHTLRNFPEEADFSRWAADTTCDFLETRDTDRAFFCLMSLFDPHDPYDDCPVEWLDAVDPTQIVDPHPIEADVNSIPRAIDLERRRCADTLDGKGKYSDLREIQKEYYGSVAFLDHEAGRVLDQLDRSGLAESTLVIFLSDHGDMLGDRQLLTKGPYFYDPCTRIPFIIRYTDGENAGIQSGSRFEGLVQPNNVAATLLSFASFKEEELSQMMPHSKNLTEMISGRIPPRDVAVCEYRNSGYGTGGRYYDPEVNCTMVFDGRYRLNVYHEPDSESSWKIGELYDMEDDPLETDNLWRNPEYAEIRFRLLLRLID